MFKRGIGSQFNWIFSLVTGIIFLGLLFGFAMKYVDLASERQAYTIAFGMDEVISGLVGVDMYKTFESDVDFTLDFFCGDMWVNKVAKKEMRGSIVFAGNDINSDNLLFFTKSFYRPFKIRDIIYVVDMNKRICFDGGSLDMFPEPFNSYSEDCDLTVYFSSGIVEKGEIRIYGDVVEFFDGSFTTYGLDELKVGAILAGNLENYKCVFERLEESYGSVREGYIEKANLPCHSVLLGNLRLASFGSPLEDLLIEQNRNLLYSVNCGVVF